MAWSERVLSGRPSRHARDPWQGGGNRKAPAGTASVSGQASDPLADEAVRVRLAEAARAAEEQGMAAGLARGEQELAAAIVAAQALAHKLETAVPRDVDMVSRTVAELAVLIARRIIGAELRHDPSVLIAAIEAGLRQAAGASVIHVELHPMVVDVVESVWVARHGARHRGFSWSFTGDPTLSPDGCRIRTEHGLVEAGFEDQLAEVAAALDAAIPGYLGAALGPTKEAAAELERIALLAPESLPALAAASEAPAASPPVASPPVAASAAPSPAPPALLGDTTGFEGLDLATLAHLGLDDLDLDALASLGLDGVGEGAA